MNFFQIENLNLRTRGQWPNMRCIDRRVAIEALMNRFKRNQ